MRRVIVPLKDFNCRLAESERIPLDLVRELACRIAVHPEIGLVVGSGDMRVVNTRTYDRYPALSLFYKFDERTLYLTHIELRDELEVFDDVELWGQAVV